MARSWLIDGRSIAKKVKNATVSQIKDCGANRECPNCHYFIDNSDVLPEWPGLPLGVKFDPSDGELLEHLEAKCGAGNSKQHLLIDEFIPTLEWNEGICYTHPENLPGVKKDGRSVHFFHRTMNAYATGKRKRRKIHDQHNLNREDVRWHKTGKTKPVAIDGVHKGWQKIMVLYKSSKKGTKPIKSNWVMHQYHLGADKEEKDGEYVVSKIFYQQPKETDKNDEENNESIYIDDKDVKTLQTSPRTPKPNHPNPPQTDEFVLPDDVAEKDMKSSDQDTNKDIHLEDDEPYPEWLAGESQPLDNFDFCQIDESLLREEPVEFCSRFNDRGRDLIPPTTSLPKINEEAIDGNAIIGISVLENLNFDFLPGFPHFGESQPLDDFDLGHMDEPFLCKEPVESCSHINDRGCNLVPPTTSLPKINEVPTNGNATFGTSELEELESDVPPDFLHPELPFGAQESIFEWLDRL